MSEVNCMLMDYETGDCSIAMLSKKYKKSVGKIYYLLRDAGCHFNKKRKKETTDEERIHKSLALKGRKMSPEQIRLISESRRCTFNGLNGYGHTKPHNRGYVRAYVPCHPHASKDGYVMLHTILVERLIGRYLNDDEVVHHINHDRSDNRIENLQLMKKFDHCSMHMKERHAKRRNDLSTCLLLQEI